MALGLGENIDKLIETWDPSITYCEDIDNYAILIAENNNAKLRTIYKLSKSSLHCYFR